MSRMRCDNQCTLSKGAKLAPSSLSRVCKSGHAYFTERAVSARPHPIAMNSKTGNLKITAEEKPNVILSLNRRRAVTAGIMLGSFLAALEVTVVGTAMPTVIASLGGLNVYSWVFTAYILT